MIHSRIYYAYLRRLQNIFAGGLNSWGIDCKSIFVCLFYVLCSRSPIGTNHSNKYGHRQNNNIQSIKFCSFQLFWCSSTRNSDVLPNTTAFSNSLKILWMRFHGLLFPFEIRLAFYCLSPIICITRLHQMQTVVFPFQITAEIISCHYNV